MLKLFRVLALSALLIFAALPYSVAAQSSIFSQKAPTATAAQIVDANPVRTGLVIENVGSVGVAIGNVSTVTYATGFIVNVNQRVVINGAKDRFYGITSASAGDLRIWECKNGPCSIDITRINSTGAANRASSTVMGASDGTDTVNGNVLVYNLSSAITANSTTTSTASGTLAVTNNATGLGSIFRSDGTNFQLLANYSQYALSSTFGTIATTSTSDVYVSAPVTGNLTGIDFSSIDALTANDTNYITWTAVNLGQSGVGSTAMLAVVNGNTTKATGGSSLVAFARFALTVHGTAGNLAVVKGDVIRLRATATGTLAGSVTGARSVFYFTRTV